MKNFQQTPRQRRDQKNQIAKHKHKLKTSNPCHSFEQIQYLKSDYFGLVFGSYSNLIRRLTKRL